VRFAGPVVGDWWADADVAATGRALSPRRARFRPNDRLVADVYAASLSYRGSRALELALGRMAISRLRYGPIDGLRAGWAIERGPTLSLEAGLAPDELSSLPASERPVISAGAAGDAALATSVLRYDASLSWLGTRQLATSAGEGHARLGLVVTDRFWIDGDAWAVAAPRDAGMRLGLESALLAASARLGADVVVRAEARRRELLGFGLGEDVVIEDPADAVSYDTMLTVDAGHGELWGWLVRGSLDAGGTRGGYPDRLRGWLAPGVSARSPAGRVRARVAYRAEIGWSGAQLLELGAVVDTGGGLRFDVLQQVGALVFPDLHAVEPMASTWLGATYAWSSVELGLRGRALVGLGGNGGEGLVELRAHD
jgi:hypothetical protein